MRTSGAGSSRSEQDDDSPMRNSQETSCQYTDQQQAELFRKLDSLKGHVLRGQDSPRASHPPPPPAMGFHGPPTPYYNPPYGMYPSPGPHGFPMHQSLYPGHYPNQMLPRPPYPPQGHYVDIGPDILDPQLHDPRFFPTRYPVSHHPEKIRPFSPPHGGGGQGHHHTRRPSEVNSETGDGAFARGYVQTAAGSRRCHPLAGGAPFAACHNCFELLYLPRKKLLSQEKQQQQKLQCGACSEVFSFTIVHNKLLFSSSSSSALEETQRVPVVVTDCPLKDEEPITHLENKTVQAISPSEHSDDDDEGGRSSVSSEVVKSVRRRAKDAPPPPPPENSNLLELFEYSNVNRTALTYGMSQLGYNKQVSYTKQDSLASETDISYNGYYNNNTEVSDNSRISNASKDERRRKQSSDYNLSEATRNNKTRSSDDQYDRELEVWVNGHLIPEDQVISAEKQAGPVQAGNYWYDYRAGFWGVMGHPCLGIIPPFIEEFSRPMPDNCGAGNTGVFVNGRELHERDLELLSSRGLPRGKNRSYIVDISGRVLDGDSGEELKCLGKLAPTIEKVKHGFGMRVPRYLASST
ncbi:uncharacterized protein LOC108853597 [Raphanus sativus]|uniref:Uncharacterized protein LOC108853597 n=1 Tax=Raphanus sativus TaxID=3726 RepID=A0A9W3C4J6_RAPSA|nr:uncharacterized protein LOC108853597 [Raphanus sativus]XP_056846451.1 uncharacterized protein LOC108853597 [Raphanus sativus]